MRRRYWMAAAGLACGLALACQERLAGSDDPEGSRWCAPVAGAFVYDGEGNKVGAVLDEDGGTIFVCRCIPFEEGLDGVWDAEVNDAAFDQCLEHAARMGYPDSNNCEELHAMNHWAEAFGVLPEDEGEVCEIGGASEPTGCSVR